MLTKGQIEPLLAEWEECFAAFRGAFDTPIARRQVDNEFARDARTRMRVLNITMQGLAQKVGIELRSNDGYHQDI